MLNIDRLQGEIVHFVDGQNAQPNRQEGAQWVWDEKVIFDLLVG